MKKQMMIATERGMKMAYCLSIPSDLNTKKQNYAYPFLVIRHDDSNRKRDRIMCLAEIRIKIEDNIKQ